MRQTSLARYVQPINRGCRETGDGDPHMTKTARQASLLPEIGAQIKDLQVKVKVCDEKPIFVARQPRRPAHKEKSSLAFSPEAGS